MANGGKLIAAGTSTNPIKFLSSFSTPGLDDWYGIRVKRGGSARVEYCYIRNAYGAISYEVGVLAADTIKNVHIAKGLAFGINADSTPNLVVRNCGIDSIGTGSVGRGIGVNLGALSNSGAKIIGDTVRACLIGMAICGSTSPVENCMVIGSDSAHTGDRKSVV